MLTLKIFYLKILEIGSAFENIGFVALSGHFLSDTLVENLYHEIKQFFQLPQETKDSYEIEGIGGQREPDDHCAFPAYLQIAQTM